MHGESSWLSTINLKVLTNREICCQYTEIVRSMAHDKIINCYIAYLYFITHNKYVHAHKTIKYVEGNGHYTCIAIG